MYMFKSKYNAASREVTIYDAEGCWIGSLKVTWGGMVTHKMTPHLCRFIECPPFELTDESLKKFAVEAASHSGLDDDVMWDIEEASTVVADWTIDTIVPKKADIKPSGDPIFDAWMKR